MVFSIDFLNLIPHLPFIRYIWMQSNWHYMIWYLFLCCILVNLLFMGNNGIRLWRSSNTEWIFFTVSKAYTSMGTFRWSRHSGPFILDKLLFNIHMNILGTKLCRNCLETLDLFAVEDCKSCNYSIILIFLLPRIDISLQDCNPSLSVT